jgi:two-component system nitrate/nitrite response regulator NarL
MPPPHRPPIVRVLLVDDSEAYTTALALVLNGNPRFAVVGRALDGEDGIGLAEELGPDVVVVDVNMPRLDGFATAREIRERLPQTRIVIVTGEPRPEHARAARLAGADVYLPKDVDYRTLSDVLSGEAQGDELQSLAFAS